ncbi:MAG TPA: hypothetical protein VF319_15125 [Caldimonas sp.]
MFKPLCLAALTLIAPGAWADAPITEAEARLIAAGMPVVRYARRHDLPVDIVVQPDATPEASPIAMGIKDGRCKLVLSMRGNPDATALLASVPPGLYDAVVEAVFAHEIGHCWRYVQGKWNALPAGFANAAEDADIADDAELASLQRAMRETRREEAFADLVGLAWTRRAHPQQYASVRAWFERFRIDTVRGEHHDTGAWLRLAREPSAFDGAGGLFRPAEVLWERGLRTQD